MQTRTVTERVGEYLGPVDWAHPDLNGYPKESEILQSIEDRQNREDKEEDVFVVLKGYDRPRRVLVVGMYDGWPFWRPYPSVLVSGPFGSEWTPFYNVYCIVKKESVE